MISEKVRVASIQEKIREIRLRWLGQVKRKIVNEPMRRYETINLMHCRRGSGRPKLS